MHVREVRKVKEYGNKEKHLNTKEEGDMYENWMSVSWFRSRLMVNRVRGLFYKRSLRNRLKFFLDKFLIR